jgi:ABC-type glycerol-3-phosphate transport system substrate-binding protein
MVTRLSLVAAFACFALVVGATQPGLSAQTTPPQPPNMQDMMKMHEQMMAEMTAGDAKLDALVKEMNAATGEAKVNAVAAVVNELVRQQRAMHGRMGEMHQHMMGMGRGMMMRR